MGAQHCCQTRVKYIQQPSYKSNIAAINTLIRRSSSLCEMKLNRGHGKYKT